MGMFNHPAAKESAKARELIAKAYALDSKGDREGAIKATRQAQEHQGKAMRLLKRK